MMDAAVSARYATMKVAAECSSFPQNPVDKYQVAKQVLYLPLTR